MRLLALLSANQALNTPTLVREVTMERKIMPTHSKKSIKEIIFLSLRAVMFSSSVILGLLILVDVSTRLFTNPIFYPSP
jgi:hypothetical protein